MIIPDEGVGKSVLTFTKIKLELIVAPVSPIGPVGPLHPTYNALFFVLWSYQNNSLNYIKNLSY